MLRKVLFAVGLFLIFGSVGTSDFHTMELHQVEPSYVWQALVIGFLCCVPMTIQMLRKENEDV